MGMFDEIRSSYPELPGYFQTKDLDCYLFNFYLDPAGCLWRSDCSGTHSMSLDPTLSSPKSRIKFIPNGGRGRVTPVFLNRKVIVTQDTTSPDGYTEVYQYELHFEEGVLQSFSIL